MKIRMKNLFPDPFQIAIILSGITLITASFSTPYSFSQNLLFWGEGLWSLLAFTTQMCLILLGGFVLAKTRAIKKCLEFIASKPSTPLQSYLVCFAVSALCCWLNWGMGLILGAFLCVELGKKMSRLHFPLLVTTSYMGFIFWHGGLSGSIPLVVATKDGFSSEWMGKTLNLKETLFSDLNLLLLLSVFLAFVLLIMIYHFFFVKTVVAISEEQAMNFEIEKEKSDNFQWTWALLLFLLISFLLISFGKTQFHMGINEMNLLLFTLGVLFHRNLANYLYYAKLGSEKLVPILVQFPIYGAIMTVIVKSGLGEKISYFFVNMSEANTFTLYSFLSAGLVNIFVPSGGGQWAVQAPIVIEGAKNLNIPLAKAVLAVAWGDAWTNLAQPFWALPLLSIANVSIKSIYPYCLGALVVSGLVISSVLYFC